MCIRDRYKARMIQLLSHELYADKSRQCSCNAGNAQIDENAFGNLSDTYLHDATGKSEIWRKHCNKKPGKSAVKKNLKNTVESNQARGIFRIAFGQFIPDDDHRDAAREPNHDQAHHVFGLIG